MWDQFERTELLLGSSAMQLLADSHVAVFGLGGVGGYAVEALARSGVGSLTLVDGDVISRSNLNRQIIALLPDVGRLKAEVAAERLAAVNPEARIWAKPIFFSADNADDFDFSAYDYVVDAIDSVADKVRLIQRAQAAGTPIISCMGAGNKLNPMGFKAADIYATSVCPLARVMRQKLRQAGVKKLKVVFSPEEPQVVAAEDGGKRAPASVAFVPPAAGLLLAAEVIKDLIGSR